VSTEGVVVGQGYHERAGEPHAEVQALQMAGAHANGATLYCTLEPCSHTGRTGPCVVRIAEAGIGRVVAAVEDPYPLVRGRGFEYLQSRGIPVEVGVGEQAAITLNQPFFTRIRLGRPFVTLKAALSVDGCIAKAPGCRTALTSDAANRHAHRFRAEVDAIGVGVGTVLADDPLLTPRGVFRACPLTRVVFDRSLRTPPAARVLSTPEVGPVMIVTTAEAADRPGLRGPLEDRGAQILVADGTMRGAVMRLGASGVNSLLLEGGADLHESALDEAVVDMVRLYVTPYTLGAGGLKFLNGRPFSSTMLIDRRVEPIGPDVLIEGYVHRPH
jgi:diaminohydroxyphosphoribosylaminopyrimidine deaminase/5-amino-6-(5-phosphoribosylamino)uracil reductase